MKYAVRKIQFENNQSIPLIFENGKSQPKLIYLKYLILHLRYKVRSANIPDQTYIIKRLYQFRYDIQGTDFERSIINHDKLSLKSTVDSFVYNELDRISKQKLSNTYRNLFLTCTISYLKFLKEEYELDFEISGLKNLYVRKPSIVKKPLKALSDETILILYSIVNPNSEFNPFIEVNRYRNFVIIQLLLETGMRIGELLSLTVSSYHEVNRRFYIQISDQFIENDTRSKKPSIKTAGSYREISISKELFFLVHQYCSKERLSGKLSRNHNVLFISSSQGSPLSKDAVYSMFGVLSKTLEHQFGKSFRLVPHVLRYTFASSFLRFLVQHENMNMDLALEQLRNIMGWSLKSAMPAKYAADYISQRANIVNVERLKSIYNGFEL